MFLMPSRRPGIVGRKYQDMQTGIGDKNLTASRHNISPNPYASLRAFLFNTFGQPKYELIHEEIPRGFTVSRTHDKYSKRSFEWAKSIRTLLDHEYDIDHLLASEALPMLFYTEAWFGSGVHCDPENVQKLAKDALFYLSPAGSGQDKFTAGVYAGPLYDKSRPRTEIFAWQLHNLDHLPDDSAAGTEWGCT